MGNTHTHFGIYNISKSTTRSGGGLDCNGEKVTRTECEEILRRRVTTYPDSVESSRRTTPCLQNSQVYLNDFSSSSLSYRPMNSSSMQYYGRTGAEYPNLTASVDRYSTKNCESATPRFYDDYHLKYSSFDCDSRNNRLLFNSGTQNNQYSSTRSYNSSPHYDNNYNYTQSYNGSRYSSKQTDCYSYTSNPYAQYIGEGGTSYVDYGNGRYNRQPESQPYKNYGVPIDCTDKTNAGNTNDRKYENIGQDQNVNKISPSDREKDQDNPQRNVGQPKRDTPPLGPGKEYGRPEITGEPNYQTKKLQPENILVPQNETERKPQSGNDKSNLPIPENTISTPTKVPNGSNITGQGQPINHDKQTIPRVLQSLGKSEPKGLPSDFSNGHTSSKPLSSPENLRNSEIPENMNVKSEPKGIPKSMISEPGPKGIPKDKNSSEPGPNGIPKNMNSEPEPKSIPKNINSELEPKGISKNMISEPEQRDIPKNMNSEPEPNGIPKNVNSVEPEPNGIPKNMNSVEPEPKGIPKDKNSFEPEPKGVPRNMTLDSDPESKRVSENINSDPEPKRRNDDGKRKGSKFLYVINDETPIGMETNFSGDGNGLKNGADKPDSGVPTDKAIVPEDTLSDSPVGEDTHLLNKASPNLHEIAFPNTTPESTPLLPNTQNPNESSTPENVPKYVDNTIESPNILTGNPGTIEKTSDVPDEKLISDDNNPIGETPNATENLVTPQNDLGVPSNFSDETTPQITSTNLNPNDDANTENVNLNVNTPLNSVESEPKKQRISSADLPTNIPKRIPSYHPPPVSEKPLVKHNITTGETIEIHDKHVKPVTIDTRRSYRNLPAINANSQPEVNKHDADPKLSTPQKHIGTPELKKGPPNYEQKNKKGTPLLEERKTSFPEQKGSPQLQKKSSPSSKRIGTPNPEQRTTHPEQKGSPQLQKKSSPSSKRIGTSNPEQRTTHPEHKGTHQPPGKGIPEKQHRENNPHIKAVTSPYEQKVQPHRGSPASGKVKPEPENNNGKPPGNFQKVRRSSDKGTPKLTLTRMSHENIPTNKNKNPANSTKKTGGLPKPIQKRISDYFPPALMERIYGSPVKTKKPHPISNAQPVKSVNVPVKKPEQKRAGSPGYVPPQGNEPYYAPQFANLKAEPVKKERERTPSFLSPNAQGQRKVPYHDYDVDYTPIMHRKQPTIHDHNKTGHPNHDITFTPFQPIHNVLEGALELAYKDVDDVVIEWETFSIVHSEEPGPPPNSPEKATSVKRTIPLSVPSHIVPPVPPRKGHLPPEVGIPTLNKLIAPDASGHRLISEFDEYLSQYEKSISAARAIALATLRPSYHFYHHPKRHFNDNSSSVSSSCSSKQSNNNNSSYIQNPFGYAGQPGCFSESDISSLRSDVCSMPSSNTFGSNCPTTMQGNCQFNVYSALSDTSSLEEALKSIESKKLMDIENGNSESTILSGEKQPDEDDKIREFSAMDMTERANDLNVSASCGKIDRYHILKSLLDEQRNIDLYIDEVLHRSMNYEDAGNENSVSEASSLNEVMTPPDFEMETSDLESEGLSTDILSEYEFSEGESVLSLINDVTLSSDCKTSADEEVILSTSPSMVSNINVEPDFGLEIKSSSPPEKTPEKKYSFTETAYRFLVNVTSEYLLPITTHFLNLDGNANKDNQIVDSNNVSPNVNINSTKCSNTDISNETQQSQKYQDTTTVSTDYATSDNYHHCQKQLVSVLKKSSAYVAETIPKPSHTRNVHFGFPITTTKIITDDAKEETCSEDSEMDPATVFFQRINNFHHHSVDSVTELAFVKDP